MSGAVYNPPTENLAEFNNIVFTDANDDKLTLSKAKTLFLGRTGAPISVASATTFNSVINTQYISNEVSILSNSYERNLTYDNSGYCNLFTNATVDDEIQIGNTTISTTSLFGQTVNIPATTLNLTGTTTNITNDIYVNTLRAGVGNYVTNTNTCFGKDSLITTTSLGINNTACGNSSLKLQSNGANCSAFGSGALATTTAEGNTGIGALAGNTISTGTKNTAVGSACLKLATTGVQNTAIGNASGQTVSSGGNNTLLGYLTGGSVTTGSYNTLVGASSNVSSGGVASSTALGAYSSIGAYSNSTAIGGGSNTVAGATCTASNQIMLGRATETVECVGTVSSISLKTASNISVNGAVFGTGTSGSNSLFSGLLVGTAEGANNTLYGKNSYDAATDGSSNRNTVVGSNASNTGYGVMSDHTVLGYGAGGKLSTTSQQGITCVGSGANVLNNANNSTAIGYGAQATLANQIILGRSTEYVECPGTNTTNGSLKLNGGLILQTTYGAAPSSTMLGYKLSTTTLLATVTGGTGGVALNVLSTTIPTIGIYLCEASIIYSTSVAGFYVFCSISTTSATLNSSNQTNVFTSAAVQTNQVVRTTAVITTTSASTVLYAVGQSGAASQTIASGFLQFTRIA